jgi:hypothetical protein
MNPNVERYAQKNKTAKQIQMVNSISKWNILEIIVSKVSFID